MEERVVSFISKQTSKLGLDNRSSFGDIWRMQFNIIVKLKFLLSSCNFDIQFKMKPIFRNRNAINHFKSHLPNSRSSMHRLHSFTCYRSGIDGRIVSLIYRIRILDFWTLPHSFPSLEVESLKFSILSIGRGCWRFFLNLLGGHITAKTIPFIIPIGTC